MIINKSQEVRFLQPIEPVGGSEHLLVVMYEHFLEQELRTVKTRLVKATLTSSIVLGWPVSLHGVFTKNLLRVLLYPQIDDTISLSLYDSTEAYEVIFTTREVYQYVPIELYHHSTSMVLL